ncbi:type III-B CRISPR module-associated protein Cmr5 [Marinitoga litoralis]|uniref:type III-B CRISPR module-associated protein Cmr5 n=1 Tax=Marinitoga litoralis TaxID=570855 RepID=UPI001960669B|nr:type III-B CRISPR module-associated protein Cmr5 [Marinitoga litoralis]MBM7560012.1 CRISPR-associated protein Cmr5 [Marinitoga litoralis]
MKRENSTKKIAKDLVLKNSNRLNEDNKKIYRSLGSMIIQNGLYGTLVFLKAKGETHHLAVFGDIQHFLKEKNLFQGNDLLEFLENTENLSVIQDRVLEFTNWYRRYADIFIGGD